MLTAFIRPNHIGKLCSWALIRLSPHCNFNYFGYKIPMHVKKQRNPEIGSLCFMGLISTTSEELVHLTSLLL
ncbi:MAG TPA: hypothetical protein DEV85_09725 [Vibrio sp.]|nr:hypothetical protein [Vibrio sp.]